MQVQQDQVGPVFARQVESQAALHGRHQLYVRPVHDDVLDQRDVRKIVLDVEHDALALLRLWRRGRRQVGNRCLGLRDRVLYQRQFHPECGAAVGIVFHADRAAHHFEQPLRQRQAQPGAFHAGLLGPQALEWRKQLAFTARLDARTGVAHLYAQPVAFHLLGRDGDRAGVAVVLDGVGDDVEENLFEPLLIGQHVTLPVARDLVADHNIAARCHGRQQVQRLLNGRADHHGFGRNRQASGFDARDLQNFVDQPEQMLPGLENLPDGLALIAIEGSHLQQLGEAQDGIQRGAQLVAHAR